MLLVYIDETGTNYKKDEKGYFIVDGPYAIWGGIFLNESKYFQTERAFHELARKLLKIKDWQKEELHASEIWQSAKSGKRKIDDIKKYFEELFQLIAKFHIPVVFGIQQKNPKLRATLQKKELEKARIAFLHVVEHRLAELNETGVLVADSEFDVHNTDKEREEMRKLVSFRTKWRYNSSSKKREIKTKYEFEYRSNFILDQLHYVDSKESLLIQLADQVNFILRRVFEFLYLTHFPKPGRPSANIDLVPISENTFNFFYKECGIKIGTFEEKEKDVNIFTLDNIEDVRFSFTPSSSRGFLLSSQTADVQRQIFQTLTPFS